MHISVVIETIEGQSFDDKRNAILKALIPHVTSDATHEECVALVSFDSGRTMALELIANKMPSVSGSVLCDYMEIMSFDNARYETCEILKHKMAGPITSKNLVDILGIFSFDTDRIKCLKLLQPLLLIDMNDLPAIMECMSHNASDIVSIILSCKKTNTLGERETLNVLQDTCVSFEDFKALAKSVTSNQSLIDEYKKNTKFIDHPQGTITINNNTLSIGLGAQVEWNGYTISRDEKGYYSIQGNGISIKKMRGSNMRFNNLHINCD
jgi:hypothetical protein